MNLIVSVQGKGKNTNADIVQDCINAGATMIRTDKPTHCRVPIIGLQKTKVQNRSTTPYITPSIHEVKYVSKWARYVAVDCRVENKNNLPDIFSYCEHNKIRVVADIGKIEDYDHIKEKDFKPYFVTTALGVFESKIPDYDLMAALVNSGCKYIIAEGHINSTNRIKKILNMGIYNICIGAAISEPYKLTKRYKAAMID